MTDTRIYTSLKKLLLLKRDGQNLNFSPKYRPTGMFMGSHRSRLKGAGLDFQELKPYAEGDAIRNIDAKVSARMAHPYVRVYAHETDRSVYLAIDQRLNMFFGSQSKMKSVVAAEAAALVGWLTLAKGDRVGGIIIGQDQTYVQKPLRGDNHFTQLLKELVNYNQQLSINSKTKNGSISLVDTILKNFHHLNQQTSLILFTDIDGLSNTDIDNLKLLNQRCNLILFVIQDQLEHNLTAASGLIVNNGVTNQKIAVDANLAKAFNQSYQDKEQALKLAMTNSSFPISFINTESNLIIQLANKFEYKG